MSLLDFISKVGIETATPFEAADSPAKPLIVYYCRVQSPTPSDPYFNRGGHFIKYNDRMKERPKVKAKEISDVGTFAWK